jgi:hypothetical protein
MHLSRRKRRNPIVSAAASCYIAVRMHSLAHATAIVLVSLASARAEEKPNGLWTAFGSTAVSGYVDTSAHPAAQMSAGETTVSVRAVKRLMFEDRFNETPSGARVPASFVFRRSGDTNGSVTVHFELSGSAEVGVDYARYPFENPGTISTGAVQTIVFPPGQRVQSADFFILLDDIPEHAEFIRVRIPAPLTNGIVPPEYRVAARRCATVWISNQKRCVRSVFTPSGDERCLEFRRVVPPRAFFTTAHCR